MILPLNILSNPKHQSSEQKIILAKYRELNNKTQSEYSIYNQDILAFKGEFFDFLTQCYFRRQYADQRLKIDVALTFEHSNEIVKAHTFNRLFIKDIDFTREVRFENKFSDDLKVLSFKNNIFRDDIYGLEHLIDVNVYFINCVFSDF